MLPGIRFLLAAIVLSMSILIFGLGAAALLRAAHEEVANVPTRRVMPEPVFAQAAEPPPTLALLRVEPAQPEKAPEAPPAVMSAPEPDLKAVPVPRVETEKLAALKLDDVAPSETGKAEVTAVPESVAKQEVTPTEAAAPLPEAAETAPLSTEVKLAALEASPSAPAETVSVPFEQIATPAMVDPAPSATRTAALGSPAAKVEKPAAANAGEKPDRAEIRKQQRAERARERRRQAARRARLAAQQAAAAAAADPFSQPLQPAQPATTATTTTRRR
jgi:hypothetical protein